MAITIGKIDQHIQGDQVLALVGHGESAQSIARILPKEGPTNNSQSSIARWLKKARQGRRAATRQVVQTRKRNKYQF